MNVTKNNFNEAAAEIERLLPSVDFVAIDEEMTGISLPGLEEKIADLPSARFAKMRKVASNFNIIQFGVALFCKEPGRRKYVAHAFNFYAFPEKGLVNMEAGSVHFNSRNGMDWNRWILGGIPYLDQDSAESLKQFFAPPVKESEGEKPPSKPRIVLSNENDIEKTRVAIAALQTWLADEEKKGEKEFELLTTNAFLRRFMYETIQESFPGLILESRPTKSRGLSTLVALRLTDVEKLEREAQKQKGKEEEFQNKLGLRRVFLALASAKKPLVGHALMFDLLFALSHFEKLPENYEEFKELSHTLFPTVFDTQLLAKSNLFRMKPTRTALEPKDGEPLEQVGPRFSSFALGQVYKVLKEEEGRVQSELPPIEIALVEGHERYNKVASFHEAGYDAFITGCVFAYMCEELARQPDEFNGHLVMFRSFYNFNLKGEDELISKGAYLHIQGLKGLGVQELQESLGMVLKDVQSKRSECLQLSTEFEVKWIDDDSAFAIFWETSRPLIDAICEEAGAQSLKFTAGDQWFASQAPDADLPPSKRARVA
ncbi:Poly(A)-specific ribonuclease PARN (Deadenylating nuclease) (Deadenylation nuclease) (Polyadenylate-specific ribonuclease) (parn-A) [Durusdinium trenchii]|uniref:Poly(A)-specific ribonuclease PARN (Deadenylating nuclease) (Deadenylation nuclease) (Polyadenylate-specific ribonuclease) (Parn-A) n=1 Tax=Durusdinium trenchii TaxID=1381693 RepID=A0ABP0HSS5_9DINO